MCLCVLLPHWACGSPVAPEEGLGRGCQRCWMELRGVQGAVVSVPCMFPSQWGLELLGNGMMGQETPLHQHSGHCQQQPWHWGLSPGLVHSRPLLLCPSGLAGKSR